MSITITNGQDDLNVTNTNFISLWLALGLADAGMDFDYWCMGECSPETLLAALKTFKPKSISCADYIDGKVCHCGVTVEQATRYYWKLMKIAQNAVQLGVNISWV